MLLSVIILTIIIGLYFIYLFYVGPSKRERDILKSGGYHPCFFCKKEIHVKDDNCKYCKKQNYKGLRKNKLNAFIILIILIIFGLIRIYEKLPRDLL